MVSWWILLQYQVSKVTWLQPKEQRAACQAICMCVTLSLIVYIMDLPPVSNFGSSISTPSVILQIGSEVNMRLLISLTWFNNIVIHTIVAQWLTSKLLLTQQLTLYLQIHLLLVQHWEGWCHQIALLLEKLYLFEECLLMYLVAVHLQKGDYKINYHNVFWWQTKC